MRSTKILSYICSPGSWRNVLFRPFIFKVCLDRQCFELVSELAWRTENVQRICL